jgi:aspartate/methionine/tyrosine aminotransferase
VTASPIGEAYASLPQDDHDCTLLDLAQAAPPYPAAPEVVEHIVATAQHPHGADYVELGGLPHLRAAFAAELSRDYAGEVHPEQVLVTAGCNQAFCLVTSALAAPGDEVVLTLPYYFNHDMWLRLDGVVVRYLDPGTAPDPGGTPPELPGEMLPTTEQAERLLTDRTRALVLVSPGNPTGATVPPARIAEFAVLARSYGIALILDESYRSFRDTDEPAHRLFADPDWDDTVISLHSFSKDLALPGYRVGAVVGSPALIAEIMKLLDCVAICAPRIGQEAAYAGLTRAAGWRAARARELADRRQGFVAMMAERPGGFELCSAGAFFGWVRHPFARRSTPDVVRELAARARILLVPGTAFLPEDRGLLRVSINDLDPAACATLADRLATFAPVGQRSVDDAMVGGWTPGPGAPEVAGDVQPLQPPVGAVVAGREGLPSVYRAEVVDEDQVAGS